MRSSDRQRLVVTLGVVVLVAVAMQFSRSCLKWDNWDIEMSTRVDIGFCVDWLELYAQFYGQIPGKTSADVAQRLDPAVVYRAFADDGQRYMIAAPGTLEWWRKAGLIACDAWQRPLNFRLISRGRTPDGRNGVFVLAVWSSGANGRDEDGRGDDIFQFTKPLTVPVRK
jgi:hypothetical protein